MGGLVYIKGIIEKTAWKITSMERLIKSLIRSKELINKNPIKITLIHKTILIILTTQKNILANPNINSIPTSPTSTTNALQSNKESIIEITMFIKSNK